MLVDSQHRQFHYLRLSITDVCNFKCNYCLPDGYQCDSDRQFLTLSEIERLVTAFAELGVSKIRITGGEPALRKDLPDIIAAVKAVPGIDKVALTSNGFNLEKNIATWLEAGLDALNISIDSLNPESFRLITGSQQHQSILAGLDKALSLGLDKLKVNTVLMREYNLSQLDSFLNWLKHTPVSLRLIELMQTGDNQQFFEQQHVSGETIKQQIEQQGWLPIVRLKDAGPAQEYCHPDYAGKIGFILPYANDFCTSCNRLRVSATGNLHKCLFAEQGQSLRHFLQSSEQKEALKVWLQQQLQTKAVSHFLHDKQVGATKHLAMLGG